MECEEWGKRVVNLIRNRSGTFMVRNFEKIILEGDSGMYFATFQTTSCLWCTFPLMRTELQMEAYRDILMSS